ncbi:MAG: triose-phosphate isomerase [Patescibacteria group bacterium]
MTRYLVANWKMQLTAAESKTLAAEIVRLWAGQAAGRTDVAVVLCPSHLALEDVAAAVKGTSVALGAQDAFWENKGAFTGEIGPAQLKEFGCEYCLVGHSERRQHLGETDEMVRMKTAALMASGIAPIVCVGETKEERQAGKRDAVVIAQVRAAFADVAAPVGNQRVVVAYEPRWVIGSGQAVAPDDAAGSHALIRETLIELWSRDVVDRQCAVIYGGAVDPGNLAGFLAVDLIQGALVGGASLKAPGFVRLAELTADAAR